MPPAVPRATYRLQLTADFGFAQAAEVVPYLKALGISHLYASPFMKARRGSTHGYDITDHARLNPELGGEEAFAKLTAALRSDDIGLILDFVPNHVGVHFDDNPWWLDVLEWGEASPHAVSFDIDWDQLPYRARGGVLLPILGTSYGEALENGEIVLRYDQSEGSFSCWYYEHRLPIAPERYGEVLNTIVRESAAEASEAGASLTALASRYRGLRHPNRDEAPDFKAQLRDIAGRTDIIERGLAAYRAGADRPEQTLALHHLLERQHYKLGHWRLASSDINYRRFFDVNSLAGLRVEDAATFEAVHRLVAQLIADGRLQGLRLDHIDGLRDPAQYCQRLRRLVRSIRGKDTNSFYVVLEKILGEHEALPSFELVQGTTGYEWMNAISQLLIAREGLGRLDEVWRQISNAPPQLEPVLKEAKRRVLETMLTSEFTVLSRLLARIANGHYSTRDYSADSLRQALELYILHFPVYRTYINAQGPSAHDRELIVETIERARSDWFAADAGIFDFLRDAITMDLLKPGRARHSAPRVRRFALKLQQFTGPVMAKSLEDTAFYRYHRLLALNEVGGNPASNGLTADEFHALMVGRAREWPHGMTATATHDTKRGEDARARLMGLSEIADEWAAIVARWKVLNAAHVGSGHRQMRTPSVTAEYMLYQALVGGWPVGEKDGAFVERFQAYALKAAREAKAETSWLNPNGGYEDGLRQFIARILDPAISGEFLRELDSVAQRLALLGALNGLSQLTLKAMVPGVPDFYQGTELWDLSFVDPDNRRPVDFALRAKLLSEVHTPDWERLSHDWTTGEIKLAWTRRLLQLRAEDAELFASGDYHPLEVTGRHSDHVIAFARSRGQRAIVVAVMKGFTPFTEAGRTWPHKPALDGSLQIEHFSIDGEPESKREIPLSEVFATMPVAVLKARAPATSLKAERQREKV